MPNAPSNLLNCLNIDCLTICLFLELVENDSVSCYLLFWKSNR